MYVGVLLGVWATPKMTLGHALLALGLTAYVLIALRYEECDLVRSFGAAYDRWRTQSAVSRTCVGSARYAGDYIAKRVWTAPHRALHCGQPRLPTVP